jgi:hypothetical protein
MSLISVFVCLFHDSNIYMGDTNGLKHYERMLLVHLKSQS